MQIGVVILGADEPTAKIRTLLTHPQIGHRVVYLRGSIDLPHDLERCRVDCADAVFLFADKSPTSSDEQHKQDLVMIASVLTLKSYRCDLPLHVQLLRSENRAFLSAMPDWSPVSSATERGDQCICITEISASLLALSAIVPGTSTLCTNLFSAHHLPERVNSDWLREYTSGMCNEIYMASLSPGFGGWRTRDVGLYLLQHFNAMLLAVEGPDLPLSLCPVKPDKVGYGNRSRALAYTA